MKKYIFNEVQYEEILNYLAEQEELQKKSLDHLTPIMEESMKNFNRSVICYIAHNWHEDILETLHVHKNGFSFEIPRWVDNPEDSIELWHKELCAFASGWKACSGKKYCIHYSWAYDETTVNIFFEEE